MGVRVSNREGYSYMLVMDPAEVRAFGAAYCEDKDWRERRFTPQHKDSDAWQQIRPDLHETIYGQLEHMEAAATLLRDFDRRTGEALEDLRFRIPPYLRYEDVSQLRINLGACAVVMADSMGRDLAELIPLDPQSIPDTPYALLQNN